MNPFAHLDQFEAMRAAALNGPVEYQKFIRRRASESRRRAGREVQLQFSHRVERMVRLAIASSRAVLLVGPPGTGKTDMLERIVEEFDQDPAKFGLRTAEVQALWVTPEEEWTFDRLVLGETVVEGKLTSVEGEVLRSISSNKWLVLDETNRADMDRVLGGVLTWLSGKRVNVGVWREPSSHSSIPVFLDWTDSADCTVNTTDSPEISRVYLGGTDWRLLGTYNAVDAQRVFRMGQALSRRFKHVPIPPASTEDFRTIIRGHIADERLLSVLTDRITSLYDAHLLVADAQLGPGLFIDIPAYVERGFAMAFDAEIARRDANDASSPEEAATANALVDDNEETQSIGEAEETSAPETLSGSLTELEGEDQPGESAPLLAAQVEADLLEELLAEAYLISVGNITAKYEPEILQELGQRFTESHALSFASWGWILESMKSMRA